MSELKFDTSLNSMLGQTRATESRSTLQNPATVKGGPSFSDTLKNAVSETNEALMNADKQSQKFATGEAVNLHDVMIAMEKADVSLRTLNAVRGKIVEAYQEIMRMPV